MSRGKEDYRVMAEIAAERAAREQDDINHGLKSGSKSSVHDNTAAAAKSAQEAKFDREQRQSEQAVQDIVFMQLMNQHLADLDRQVADAEKSLIERFGENYDQLFYEQITGDAGAELTRDERLQQLQDIMIDPETRQVRPEFEDHPLASFLEGRFARGEFKEALDNGDVNRLMQLAPEATMQEYLQEVEQASVSAELDKTHDEEVSGMKASSENHLTMLAQFGAVAPPSPPEQPAQPEVTEVQPVETSPTTFTPI